MKNPIIFFFPEILGGKRRLISPPLAGRGGAHRYGEPGAAEHQAPLPHRKFGGWQRGSQGAPRNDASLPPRPLLRKRGARCLPQGLVFGGFSPLLQALKYAFQTNDRLCFVMEYANGGEVGAQDAVPPPWGAWGGLVHSQNRPFGLVSGRFIPQSPLSLCFGRESRLSSCLALRSPSSRSTVAPSRRPSRGGGREEAGPPRGPHHHPPGSRGRRRVPGHRRLCSLPPRACVSGFGSPSRLRVPRRGGRGGHAWWHFPPPPAPAGRAPAVF